MLTLQSCYKNENISVKLSSLFIHIIRLGRGCSDSRLPKFLQSFILQAFINYLLCARHRSKIGERKQETRQHRDFFTEQTAILSKCLSSGDKCYGEK